MKHSIINEWLGRSWCSKVRKHQRKHGTLQTARNLRKQGIGLAAALALLTGKVI